MKVWVGVILFFAVGAVIGLAVALGLLEHARSMTYAVVVGACAGAYGAWFVFFAILNLARWLKRRMARA